MENQQLLDTMAASWEVLLYPDERLKGAAGVYTSIVWFTLFQCFIMMNIITILLFIVTSSNPGVLQGLF